MKKQIGLLVVEDNPEYGAAAREYFKGIEEVNPTFVNNYQDGMKELMKGSYDKALFDLFLPEKADMKKPVRPELSSKLLMKIYEGVSSGYAEKRKMDALKYIKENKKDFRDARDEESFIERNLSRIDVSRAMDSFYNLNEAIKSEKEYSPLGIFLAKGAKNKRISSRIATSTFHHDSLTECIHIFVQAESFPPMVDCLNEDHVDEPSHLSKANPEFWERAYNELNKYQISDEGGCSI